MILKEDVHHLLGRFDGPGVVVEDVDFFSVEVERDRVHGVRLVEGTLPVVLNLAGREGG